MSDYTRSSSTRPSSQLTLRRSSSLEPFTSASSSTRYDFRPRFRRPSTSESVGSASTDSWLSNPIWPPVRSGTSGPSTNTSSDYPSSSSGFTSSTGSSMDVSTMTDDQGYDAPIGPSWRVPKEQYNLIRRHILSRKRKGKPKRKTTGKKRPYTRRRYGYRTYGRSGPGNRMGPIVIQGQGGYFTDKLAQGASAAYKALSRGLPKGTFERIGRAAGGAMFGGSGAALGGMAGRGIASLSGMGDYTIRKNSLLQLDEGMQVASFGDMNHGVIIMHREYIGDITQTQNFTLTSFPINPGLAGTFPWLSNIAPNFDQYQILGMIFHFRSTASDFGTTTNMAMGSIILATDYDSADNLYGSKIEMENAQYSTSGKPSVDVMHAIECDPDITFAPIKYVRSGGVPAGKDSRLYDQGNFQIATTGMPANSGAIGELWVTYKIAFFKPALNMGANVQTATAGATTWDALNYWGLVPTLDPNNSFNMAFSGNNMFLSNIPVNAYLLVKIDYVFGSQVLSAGLLNSVSGATQKQQGQSTVVTMVQYTYSTIVKATASLITMTLSNMTVPAAPSGVRVWVTMLDQDVAQNVFP